MKACSRSWVLQGEMWAWHGSKDHKASVLTAAWLLAEELTAEMAPEGMEGGSHRAGQAHCSEECLALVGSWGLLQISLEGCSPPKKPASEL